MRKWATNDQEVSRNSIQPTHILIIKTLDWIFTGSRTRAAELSSRNVFLGVKILMKEGNHLFRVDFKDDCQLP